MNKPQHRPRLPSIPKPMTKEQFMIEYVLRRASARDANLSADEAAKSAAAAWEIIRARGQS